MGFKYKHVPIIINPASGPDRPILNTLNTVFRATGVDWDVYVTKKAGDARRFARQMVEAGAQVVAVYGGDGTVKEAASSLAGSDIPLAIFPGGTGNALAVELGIPRDLAQAAALVCGAPSTLRAVDLGQIGEDLFILRASMGLETELLQSADRELKDHLGQLAYPLTALQQLGHWPTARYHITLDGKALEAEGVQCTIANSASLGIAGLSLAQAVNIGDGLLDVIVLTRADLVSLASLAVSNLVHEDWGAEIQHWQGCEITVAAEPPQAVALGGDPIGHTPVSARVVPHTLKVIVPDQ